jgi:hypothetical protein
MLLARQRSQGSAAFAKAGCTRDLAITQRNRCGGRQPIPTHERDRGGGRNARATSTRSRASPECPPAIHPRESPAAAGPAAIIRQAQKTLTFSLQPLSVRTSPPRNTKTSPPCAKTVDEKPSLWKPEENRERFRITSPSLPIDIAAGCPMSRRLCETWDFSRRAGQHPRPLHFTATVDRYSRAPASA